MDKKLRILNAPIVILYLPHLITKGLRELGHKADYMTYSTSGVEWLMHDKPDFNLHYKFSDGLQVSKTREIEFFLYAMENYDILHFHSNWGLLLPFFELWKATEDFSFLHKMGEKIVMSCWGYCDNNLGDRISPGGLSECDVCTVLRPVFCENNDYKKRITNSYKYSHKLLSNGRACIAYPEVKWLNNAIDCNEWRPYSIDEIPEKFRLPPTKNIRIYHAFANSAKREEVKGSAFIKAAVEKLQEEGYPVEFMFFDKVSNKDLRYYQAQADLVVDQLYVGWHGSNGVECMAVGKPVILYVNPEVAKIVSQDNPLINASIHNIYDVLKDCVSNMDKMKEIGKATREYALKHHHYEVVVKRLEAFYYSLYQ